MSKFPTKVSVAVGITSALIVGSHRGVVSDKEISMNVNFVTNSRVTRVVAGQSSGTDLFKMPQRRWSAESNLRFKELARKEAGGELSAEEWAELDWLSHLRRNSKFPLNADQILWQRKQKALTESLLKAIKDYVQFHEQSSAEKFAAACIQEV